MLLSNQRKPLKLVSLPLLQQYSTLYSGTGPCSGPVFWFMSWPFYNSAFYNFSGNDLIRLVCCAVHPSPTRPIASPRLTPCFNLLAKDRFFFNPAAECVCVSVALTFILVGCGSWDELPLFSFIYLRFSGLNLQMYDSHLKMSLITWSHGLRDNLLIFFSLYEKCTIFLPDLSL